MERIGTGIGSLHFVYCFTEQVKINLPLRILHCNYPQYHRFFIGKWKIINFQSLHLKNHQNFKGVITKEYSISRLLPVPTYKHY